MRRTCTHVADMGFDERRRTPRITCSTISISVRRRSTRTRRFCRRRSYPILDILMTSLHGLCHVQVVGQRGWQGKCYWSSAARSALNEDHFQLRFFRGFTRVRCGAPEPPFDLLQRNGMRRRRLAHVDVEHGRMPKLSSPRILPESADGDDDRLVQRFGFDVDAMADAARVSEADRAVSNRHGSRIADSLLFRLLEPRRFQARLR